MCESEAVAAIKRLYQAWKAPWETGDAVGIADYYTEDAVQMPANEPDIVGRDAFRVCLEALFNQFTVKGDSTEVVEVQTGGDLAFARGTYAIILTPKAGGKPTRYSGKFVHLLKRQPDGTWKIHRAIGVDDSSPRSEPES
jgi:uncharacterized protein (TIGR02246 family)